MGVGIHEPGNHGAACDVQDLLVCIRRRAGRDNPTIVENDVAGLALKRPEITPS
jgi:hypothetical protein